MNQLKIFIDLTRLEKPIGFMLLFWPCCWGLSFAYHFDQDINKFSFYLVLFFLGSVFMRSAGCIVNDIVDRNIDKRVESLNISNSASIVFHYLNIVKEKS